MTACEPLSINGIQEVSGSIPLISTRQKPRTLVLGFCFVETGSSYIADLLPYDQRPKGGLSGMCAGKVSGSIPFIPTRRNSHPKGWLFLLDREGLATADLLPYDQRPKGGLSDMCAGKVGGSIPLISAQN